MLNVVLLLLLIVVLATLGVVGAIFMLAQLRNQVPPVFTPPRALEQVVEALDLPETGRFVDLGCGDGRVLDVVTRARPKLQAVGVENNPVVVAIARLRLKKRATVTRGQIEDAKFEGVQRVFCYLGPGLMELLEPRFERELPKGARVVSQQFPVPYRKPVRVVELAHGKPYAETLYVYDY